MKIKKVKVDTYSCEGCYLKELTCYDVVCIDENVRPRIYYHYIEDKEDDKVPSTKE